LKSFRYNQKERFTELPDLIELIKGDFMSYIEEMFGIRDKVVVLTGGAGVIASGMAEAILKAGGKVVLWDRTKEILDEAKKRLENASGVKNNIYCSAVDAFKENEVKAAIEEVEKNFGIPDVLINAAGGNRGKTNFVDIDVESFDFVMKLNLIAGLVVPTKIMCAYWISKKIKGSIINMTSMSSYVPLSGVWAYDAAKAGVLNLTMATAKEFAQYGIRVNAIAPGFFVGKQNKELLIKDEKTGELTDRGNAIVSRTPFGRFGNSSELIGTTLFLISDKASGFITGVSIPVDGGYLVDNI
jgi:NAD(P)-dependent dehydrogenase (short-subunit alcohol dehydrogenase family)